MVLLWKMELSWDVRGINMGVGQISIIFSRNIWALGLDSTVSGKHKIILGFLIVGNPPTYQHSSILFGFCWIIVSPLFLHRRLQHYRTSNGYFPLSLSLSIYIDCVYIYNHYEKRWIPIYTTVPDTPKSYIDGNISNCVRNFPIIPTFYQHNFNMRPTL